MLWTGGAQAVPYAIAVMAVQSVGASVAINYVQTNYAEYVPKPSEILRGRNLLYGGLVLFLGGGLFRALLDLDVGSGDGGADSFFGGAVPGAIAGLISAPVILGIAIFLKRRNAASLNSSVD